VTTPIEPEFDVKAHFESVYQENRFNGGESRSGEGSSLSATSVIREELPKLLQKLNIRTILDIPCGDLHWISQIDKKGASYLGADISHSLIENNKRNYSNFGTFMQIDAIAEIPPKVDLIFCRDMLVHLPNEMVKRVLANFCKSQSTWLLTTTFTHRVKNKNFSFSKNQVAWRPLNLERAPFNFPSAEVVINEDCKEGNGLFSDKSLGLWKIEDLDLKKLFEKRPRFRKPSLSK